MEGIEASIPYDNQPIQASIFNETRLLTSWITPDSLEVQNKYNQLTSGLTSTQDKVLACFNYVASIPYTQFVRVSANVAGKTFVQPDAWLLPEEAIFAGKLNCMNKSCLFASLVGNELPKDNVWVTLGNLVNGHPEGHAWVTIGDQIFETTADKVIPSRLATRYEDVVYFSNSDVRVVPDRALSEPVGISYSCVRWLQDYLATEFCRT